MRRHYRRFRAYVLRGGASVMRHAGIFRAATPQHLSEESEMRPKSLPLSIRAGSSPRVLTTPQPRPPATPRRLRDWIATLIIVVCLPLGLIAGDRLMAASPTMTFSGSAIPGADISISGSGFHPKSGVQLYWDDSPADGAAAHADSHGSFSTTLVIPADAATGAHVLSAVSVGAAVSVEATITVVVLALPFGDATVSPSPSLKGDPSSAPPSPESPGHSGHGASPTPSVADASPTPSPIEAPTLMPQTPPSCGDYGERRIFLEGQSWWMQTTGRSGTEFGHVHVGTCFPYKVKVSGELVFDVRIKMFHNPGTLIRLQPHIVTANSQVTFTQRAMDWIPAGGTGEIWQRVRIDTTRVPYDGLQELRMWAQIREPDGKEMHVSTGWQLNLANGSRPVLPYRVQGLAFTEGRGWYTGAQYTVARFSSVIPAVVSGKWAFNVDLKPGAGGIPVTSHAVRVDSDAHADLPGMILKKGKGQYIGPVSVDTTQLSNGYHRLFLKANAAAPAGSTNSGVLVLYFNVQN
jgi:hypothetical protein